MGEEGRPRIVGVDVVEIRYYVQKESGDVEAGSLKGPDHIGEDSDNVRCSRAREGAHCLR